MEPSPQPAQHGEQSWRSAPFLPFGSEQAGTSLEEVSVEDLSMIPGYSQENVPRGRRGMYSPAAFAARPTADSQSGQTAPPGASNRNSASSSVHAFDLQPAMAFQ